MKKFFILLLFVTVVLSVNSQIQYLRYNDNFSYLTSDSVKKAGFHKLKYIPLAKSINVSFGGEIREQLQYYDNINFGDVPPTYPKASTWQLWHRLMTHANLDVGKKTRIFIQLGSTYRLFNPNPLTPEIEQNELSVHQVFIDHQFSKHWMARIGRQEMSYGSHRLITFREGPNTRLAFDAVVFKYNREKTSIDIFAISPVISKKGVFDDQSFKDFAIGIYASEKLSEKISIDYYLLHFYSKRRLYSYISGTEKRKFVGFRLFSENQKANYELEGTYQFGKFNHLLIKAYGVSADINYKILPVKSLTVGVAANYLTGDENTNDDQLNTYNLLYSKPQFGLTAPIGATNLVNINSYFKISPSGKSNIYAGANFMWRQSIHDGIYSPGAIEMRPKPEAVFTSARKRIGTLLVLETNYKVNNHLYLSFDISKLLAGAYVKETGKGKDISYLSFKANYKF